MSKKFWIVIKKILLVLISIFEGVLCSLLANELYQNNKIQWKLVFSAKSFPWIIIVVIILILLAIFDTRDSFSLVNKLREEKVNAYIKSGVYDEMAEGLKIAIRNKDKNAFSTLKSMEEELESGNK